MNEASANLSASADVFVLAVEYNPYKYFKCLNVLNGHFDNDFDFDRYHGYYGYHKFIHTSLAITPDGQRLVSSRYWDDTIEIWNLNTGELLSTLEACVHCVAITPDGQTLVSGCADSTIKIWDLKTNELRHSLHCSNEVYLVAITPDGQKLISVEDSNIIQIWDLNNQELLRNLGTYSLYSRHYWWNSNCIVISPDQQRIIMGREIIKSYDLITGKLRTIIGCNSEWIYALAITPDGKTLITSHNNNTIKIWDLTKEYRGVRLTLKSSAIVRTLTVTPDSQRIVSVGNDDDDYESFIEIWDLNTGEKLHSIEEYFSSHIEEHFIDYIKESSVAQVRCLAFSILRERGLDPMPSLVMQVIQVLQAMDSGILSRRKSNRTPSLAIAIQVVQDYLKEYFSRANRVYCLAITPDGKQIISGYTDGTIRIWGIPELSM